MQGTPSFCSKCKRQHFASAGCAQDAHPRFGDAPVPRRPLGDGREKEKEQPKPASLPGNAALRQLALEAAEVSRSRAQARPVHDSRGGREEELPRAPGPVPQRRGLDPSLAQFLLDVLHLRGERGGSIQTWELEALMRRDEPFALQEPGYTQRNYFEALQHADIGAPEEGFYEERGDLAADHAPRYRLYINALPSAALAIFEYLRPKRFEIDGMTSVKVAGLGSFGGRRDMVVAYFIDAASAVAAAQCLKALLESIGDWPWRWVRNDVLPGTYRVEAGMGVAWDPQHLFEGAQFDFFTKKICFGTTHTERYCGMIEAFLLQVAQTNPAHVVEAFARWISEHTDPLAPYNPPLKFPAEKPELEKKSD